MYAKIFLLPAGMTLSERNFDDLVHSVGFESVVGLVYMYTNHIAVGCWL
jgi:hypothetical protein